MRVEEVLANASISDAPSTSAIPEAPAATTNDLHDPHILSDYGGPLFRHERSMLKQLDMRDENNELVPPSAWYSTFTPGSLVMVRYTMHAFNWPNRRVYQLNAHSIRLLDKSDEAIDDRITAELSDYTPTAGPSNTAASAAMASFSLGKWARK
ncbi:hypothetical protein BJ138DRAFT_1121102 [Hygrophoropsis aurantiaca]|uniref:Uncharacterized protein n=1 Tax=Hygrophoropsis aurantiaca TaxID=72124 RepID=A0ACB7ZNW8_9AGAM|nr:hypothetical protein BJ138DRAFT_1121102 [Hygrophoropsis aurantiaca]